MWPVALTTGGCGFEIILKMLKQQKYNALEQVFICSLVNP
jgi:hypothetical protein